MAMNDILSPPSPQAVQKLATTVQPLTAAEQYWATRALKAEALLAAQETHKKEIRNLGHENDMKREWELKLLAKEHKEKHAALEKLLTFLLVIIAVLLILIIYLATHYTRHSMLLQHKQHERWWSTIGTSHFTIPILSPFTSVVEHEASLIGTRLIVTLVAIGACLAYMTFRHWFANQLKRASSGPSNTTSRGVATEVVSRVIDR